MAGDSAKKIKPGSASPSGKSAEELIAGFNALRAEQRQIASKIFELENDFSEHKIVIENLKIVAEDRKCYRMVGGILIEKTVKDVLPDLETNSEKIKSAVEGLNSKLIEKGKEIMEYKDKHNIQIQAVPTSSGPLQAKP